MMVHDILNAKSARLVTIPADASLQGAGRTILRERIGTLLIKDGKGKIAGMIAERDISLLHRNPRSECRRRTGDGGNDNPSDRFAPGSDYSRHGCDDRGASPSHAGTVQ